MFKMQIPPTPKEMAAMALDLEPGYGDEVTRLMKSAINQPADNITLLRNLIKFE